MLNPVSSATQSHGAVQPTAVPPPAHPKPVPVTVSKDTVQLSAAALAMQEALETAAQTVREAAAGDIQAKHLLAREAAVKVGH